MSSFKRTASSAPNYGSDTRTLDHGLDTSVNHDIEDDPPPVYSPVAGQVDLDQEGFQSQANITEDGRLNINIDQKVGRFSSLLVTALEGRDDQSSSRPPSPEKPPSQDIPPPLNIVIHVVGSRGDVQPFVALGKVLREIHGHRVRLATHGTFKSFVESNGLEFFSIGGDPAELMAFMVKNPGLMPGMESLKAGDVGNRRKGMYEIILGCWRSCIEIGDGMGTLDAAARPFVADAIIANPPSFAHVHCAEKLGIPLHLMFTSVFPFGTWRRL